MKYAYYPGCSLEATAIEYDLSTRSVLALLGAELVEFDDWTCCGASAAEATSELLSMVLPARNLALAEKDPEIHHVLAPCSACYLNLKKVEVKIRKDANLLQKINLVLAEEHLRLEGRIQVRHLLDVLANDIELARMVEAVKTPLKDMRIAPYYGCQCLRPYKVFDDPEAPTSMEPLISASGARIFEWSMGARCCGAALLTTKKPVGMEFITAILKAAKGADAIATVCPMCQMNLEAFQKEASSRSHEDLRISVLYLPQLLGLAMGLTNEALGLGMNLALTDAFQQKLAAA